MSIAAREITPAMDEARAVALEAAAAAGAAAGYGQVHVKLPS